MMTLFGMKHGPHFTIKEELEACTEAARQLLSDVFELSVDEKSPIDSGKMVEMMKNVHMLFDLAEEVKKEKFAKRGRGIPSSPRIENLRETHIRFGWVQMRNRRAGSGRNTVGTRMLAQARATLRRQPRASSS